MSRDLRIRSFESTIQNHLRVGAQVKPATMNQLRTLIALVLTTTLVVNAQARLTYLPQSFQSTCCKRFGCHSYGCLVNKGKGTNDDPNTPCNPPHSWMYCDSSGCNGKSCGNCECRTTWPLQREAIKTDLKHDALFFAYLKGESTPLRAACGIPNPCGNNDRDTIAGITLNIGCKKEEDCGEDSECCDGYSCRRVGSSRKKKCHRDCKLQGDKCSSHDQCCTNLGSSAQKETCYADTNGVFIHDVFAPKRCRPCKGPSERCRQSSECCDGRTCKRKALGPKRCR